MTRAEPPEPLRVRILDVGQGDAIVAILPGARRALVVDAFDGPKVLSTLEDEGVEELVLFLSHSDADHVRGVDYLIDNFDGTFVACFFNGDRLSATLKSAYVTRLRFLASATRAQPGSWSAPFDIGLNSDTRFASVALPPVAIEVLHPTYDERMSFLGASTNEASGVLRLSYRLEEDVSRCILLTGDVQLTGISCMMHRLGSEGGALRADVIKYPHHGSWPKDAPGMGQFPGRTRRTMQQFLEAVDPEVICLSVGFANPRGHVRPEVFGAFAALARGGCRLARVLCTQFTAACLRRREACDPARCAADIEVRIGEDIPRGMEVMPSPTEHLRRILSVTDRVHAGCAPLLD